MIKVKFAEMHSPIFVNGVNLGMKLDPELRGGLSLEYDRAEKELHITMKGVTSIAPASSVAHYTPANTDEVIAVQPPIQVAQPKLGRKAQVWDPTNDVQNPPQPVKKA